MANWLWSLVANPWKSKAPDTTSASNGIQTAASNAPPSSSNTTSPTQASTSTSAPSSSQNTRASTTTSSFVPYTSLSRAHEQQLAALVDKNRALLADNQNLRRTWRFLTDHVTTLESTLRMFQGHSAAVPVRAGDREVARSAEGAAGAALAREPETVSVHALPAAPAPPTILNEGYSTEPEPIEQPYLPNDHNAGHDGIDSQVTHTNTQHSPTAASTADLQSIIAEQQSALSALLPLQDVTEALQAENAHLRREAVSHYTENQRLRTEALAAQEARRLLDEKIRRLVGEKRRSNSMLSVKTLEMAQQAQGRQGSIDGQVILQRRGTGAGETAPKTTVEDVTRLLERLNEEIFQTAAHIADSAGHVAPPGEIQEAAVETLRILLGEDMLPVVLEKIKSSEEGCPVEIVQAAVQASLVLHCFFTTNRWTGVQDKNEWLIEVYGAVRSMTENDTIAGRWRALAKAAIDCLPQSEDGPGDEGDEEEETLRIIGGLLQVLTSLSRPMMREVMVASFQRKLEEIVRLRIKMQTMVWQDIVSEDLTIMLIQPDEIFDASNMEDEFQEEVQEGEGHRRVACTTSMGVKGVRKAGEKVHLKPKVALVKTLAAAE